MSRTVRDDIALRAMDVLIMRDDFRTPRHHDPLGQGVVGQEAYRIADDMLRARGEDRPVKPEIGWVEVRIGLPPVGEPVLVWTPSGQAVAWWHRGPRWAVQWAVVGGRDGPDGAPAPLSRGPTHWKWLPKPPEGT